MQEIDADKCAALINAAQRPLVEALREHMRDREMMGWKYTDHACAECGGSIPRDGFRCVYHDTKELLPPGGARMTKNEAIALYESGFWKDMTHEERAWFQLHEPLLCMPFGVFHEAVEKTLGRPVYTHEFGSSGLQNLQKELHGEQPPTLADIINLIPADKRIILLHSEAPDGE